MNPTSYLLLSVQEAVLDTLRQDADLMSKVTGIYNRSPSSPEYPYLVLEGGDSIPIQTMTHIEEQITITLHLYSDASDEGEMKAIVHDVERLLEQQPLFIEGFGEVLGAFVSSQSGFTPDHQVVSMTFRFI